MTVKELMEELKKYDENLTVIVDGYEGGAEDLVYKEINKVIIALNVRGRLYAGEHGYCEKWDDEYYASYKKICALRIGRSG